MFTDTRESTAFKERRTAPLFQTLSNGALTTSATCIMMEGLNAAEAAFEIINRHQGRPIPEKVQRQYIEHGTRLGQPWQV